MTIRYSGQPITVSRSVLEDAKGVGVADVLARALRGEDVDTYGDVDDFDDYDDWYFDDDDRCDHDWHSGTATLVVDGRTAYDGPARFCSICHAAEATPKETL